MGGKSGGGGPEIRDFLLSMDYGICHGPVDSINQVYVKDKRILCGLYEGRSDVFVNLPGLFGGDEGEGGVVGMAELYTGTDDQLQSPELALRQNLPPSQLPGYRGLAHIFFRGFLGRTQTAVQSFLENESPAKGILPRLGFQWTSNNPYLPPCEVNVTRCPQTLGEANSRIPATIGVNQDGSFQSFNNFQEDRSNRTTQIGSVPFLERDRFFEDDDVEANDYLEFNLSDIGLDSQLMQEALTSGKDIEYSIQIDLEKTNQTGPELQWDIEVIGGLTAGTQSYDSSGDPGWSPGSSYSRTWRFPLDPNTTGIRVRARHWQASGEVVNAVATLRLGLIDAEVNFDLIDPSFFENETTPLSLLTGGSGYDTFDLYQFGYDQDDIDGGLVNVFCNLGVSCNFVGLAGDGPANHLVTGEMRFWNYDENGSVNYIDGVFSGSDSGRGYRGVTLSETAPLGARFVDVRFRGVRIITLFSEYGQGSNSSNVTGRKKVRLPICPINATGKELMPDANPAHIIHEALVNPDWGKGENPALIDLVSFETAAQTLFEEKFGLSLGWFAQESIEDFIREVLDHIQAVLYQNPATGLWTLRLLRDDYDPATLRIFDETNCVASKRKRKAWGETINEIIVSYTNPGNEKDATVPSHNLANIQIQGGVISETRDYYGVRNPWLAKKIADRDVQSAGYPLFSCVLECDRRAWDVTPGEVIKFSWAEDGLVEMICRVMNVDYGSPKNRAIRIDITEDIFALGQQTYVGPQEPPDTGNEVDPAPVALTNEMVVSTPWPLLSRNGVTDADLAEDPDLAAVLLLGDHNAISLLDLSVQGEVTLPNGTTSVDELFRAPATETASLLAPLAREASSTIDSQIVFSLLGFTPSVGSLLMIGDTEATSEIVMLDSIAGTDLDLTFTFQRGVWDTIPRAWPTGSTVWVMPTGTARVDPTARGAGEPLTYRLLPRTGRGQLAYSDATDLAYTATNRAAAPFRPGAVRVETELFADLSYEAGITYPTTLTVDWSNRDRTTEDNVYVPWTTLAGAAQPGQTTAIEITDYAGAVTIAHDDLPGETYELPFATLQTAIRGTMRVRAKDSAGNYSLWGEEIHFVVNPGYGGAYGVAYG